MSFQKEGNKIFQTDKRQGIKDQNHKEKYREGFDEGEVILHTLVAVTIAPHRPRGRGAFRRGREPVNR